MIYLLIENSNYGVSPYAFETELSRSNYLEQLLKEYSNEYKTDIKTTEDLHEKTSNQAWIDLFEIEVSK